MAHEAGARCRGWCQGLLVPGERLCIPCFCRGCRCICPASLAMCSMPLHSPSLTRRRVLCSMPIFFSWSRSWISSGAQPSSRRSAALWSLSTVSALRLPQSCCCQAQAVHGLDDVGVLGSQGTDQMRGTEKLVQCCVLSSRLVDFIYTPANNHCLTDIVGCPQSREHGHGTAVVQAPVFSQQPRLPSPFGQFVYTFPLFRRVAHAKCERSLHCRAA